MGYVALMWRKCFVAESTALIQLSHYYYYARLPLNLAAAVAAHHITPGANKAN